MLERTERLDDLDRRWERRAYREMEHPQALSRFAALWEESLRLRDEPVEDWREDLEADLAIARAVNAVPSS